MVAKLVLQTERLVSSSGYVGFTLQFTPTVIISESNQVTFVIGHLTRDADLVAVKVVGFLAVFAVFIGLGADLCQEFVAVVLPSRQPSPTREGVDVGMEKSSSNTFLIYINPKNCLNCSIPSTLPKNKEKAKKSFPIFCLLNFLTP